MALWPVYICSQQLQAASVCDCNLAYSFFFLQNLHV